MEQVQAIYHQLFSATSGISSGWMIILGSVLLGLLVALITPRLIRNKSGISNHPAIPKIKYELRELEVDPSEEQTFKSKITIDPKISIGEKLYESLDQFFEKEID